MTIIIRGEVVAPAFLVQNIVWDVLVVIMWSFLAVIMARFRQKLKNYNGSHKRSVLAKKIRLAHLFAIAVLSTILGIDPSVIYFSGAGYINLAATRTLLHCYTIVWYVQRFHEMLIDE